MRKETEPGKNPIYTITFNLYNIGVTA